MHYSERELMFALIRYEVCDMGLFADFEKSLTPDIISKAFELAYPQDMSHIIASAALNLGIDIPDELKQKLERSQMTAVYRHALLRHELARVCATLEEEKIPYIPLKGSVLRSYYKRPEMRTSCDIDVFVSEENLDRAAKAFEERLSYELDVRTPHDVAFYSKSKTHVELHFDLIERDEKVKCVLERVWELSHTDGNEYRHLMNRELFFAYHVAHMAKHFMGGGCGLRPLLDLWIIEHKMGYDKAVAEELVSAMGLEKFAREALALSEVWFSGKEPTATTKQMEDYILGGGVYGSAENRMAAMQTVRGGKFRYVMGRIFLPFSRLKKIYPRLEKYPILLPYYEVKRWLSYLSRKGISAGRSELKAYSSVADEKQISVSALFKELELEIPRI